VRQHTWILATLADTVADRELSDFFRGMATKGLKPEKEAAARGALAMAT